MYLPDEVVDCLLRHSINGSGCVQLVMSSGPFKAKQVAGRVSVLRRWQATLYSFALVSKQYCRIAVPLLYSEPLFLNKLFLAEAIRTFDPIEQYDEKEQMRILKLVKTLFNDSALWNYSEFVHTFDLSWLDVMTLGGYTQVHNKHGRNIQQPEDRYLLPQGPRVRFCNVEKLVGIMHKLVPSIINQTLFFQQCGPNLSNIDLKICHASTLQLLSESCKRIQHLGLDLVMFDYKSVQYDELGQYAAWQLYPTEIEADDHTYDSHQRPLATPHRYPAVMISRMMMTNGHCLQSLSLRSLLTGFDLISSSLSQLIQLNTLNLVECDLTLPVGSFFTSIPMGPPSLLSDESDDEATQGPSTPDSQESPIVLFRVASGLKHMRLEACRGLQNDALVPLLGSCSRLESLHLRWTQASELALCSLLTAQAMADYPLLRLTLNGAFPDTLTRQSLGSLVFCKHLQALEIQDTSFDLVAMDEVISSIGHHLKRLQLVNGFQGIPLHDLNLLVVGQSCSQIESLDISFAGCTSPGVQQMFQLLDQHHPPPRLKELNMIFCSLIQPRSLLLDIFKHDCTSQLELLDLSRCGPFPYDQDTHSVERSGMLFGEFLLDLQTKTDKVSEVAAKFIGTLSKPYNCHIIYSV